MRTLENPVLNEELVGPMVCWLEIELSLIESTYDVPALMLVLQPGRSSSLGPSVWHSPLANRSWGWHSAEPNSEMRLQVFGQSVSATWRALLQSILSKQSFR